MTKLLDGTCGKEDIVRILDQMQENCPNPSTKSKKLWCLRRKLKMSDKNSSHEVLLERSVAMLAHNEHMVDWYNQCPIASGIGGSDKYKRMCLDLIRWCSKNKSLWLTELKWCSDNPPKAIKQILRYGAIYFYCRKHKHNLSIDTHELMSATNIVLQVVAPAKYYSNHDRHETLRCLSRARESIQQICKKPEMKDLTISLDVLSLPKWFDQLPFSNRKDVERACGKELTKDGTNVIKAFNELIPEFPE